MAGRLYVRPRLAHNFVSLILYQKPNLIDLLQVCHEMTADEREQYEAFHGVAYDPLKCAAALSFNPGPSWALFDGTKPIAAAGFEEIRRGVWQDWMVSTPAAWEPRNWRETTRYVRQAMGVMLKSGAHRLQCISLRSRIGAHKWYHVLGLRQEGVLEAYGVDGQDAIMFARLRVEK
jgi:hypothetical protein